MRPGKKNPDLQRLSITGCASVINKTTPEKQTVLPGHSQQTSFSTHVFSYVTLRMSHSLFPGPGNCLPASSFWNLPAASTGAGRKCLSPETRVRWLKHDSPSQGASRRTRRVSALDAVSHSRPGLRPCTLQSFYVLTDPHHINKGLYLLECTCQVQSSHLKVFSQHFKWWTKYVNIK